MEYTDYVRLLQNEHADLAAEIASFRGLGTVMEWMKGRSIRLADAEIIHQDEYSLDFVVPLDAVGNHLAFGIT